MWYGFFQEKNIKIYGIVPGGKKLTTLNIPTDTQPSARIFDNFLVSGVGLRKVNWWPTNPSSN